MERVNGYLICTICKRYFFTKFGFQLHKNKEHSQEHDSTIANPCSLVKECLNKSVEENNLVSSIETDHVYGANDNEGSENILQSFQIQQENCEKTEPLQCPLQSENNNADKQLLKHQIKSVHNKMKHIQCQLCKKRFRCQSAMTYHKQAVHEKIKPFQCQKCDMSFGRGYHLKRHIKGVHDKIKLFQCQTCKKTFRDLPLLKCHIQGVHKKIKPFYCQVCNKGFSQRTHFNIHEKE